MVGDSVEEAREKRARLDSLVHYDSAIASLSIALGHDASASIRTAPLPEIPETNASKSGRERVIALARRENLTVRQLAQRLGGYGGLAFVGTPRTIADADGGMARRSAAATASTSCSRTCRRARRLRRPRRAGVAAARPVPARISRATLRENLGLPRPENRFFPTSR